MNIALDAPSFPNPLIDKLVQEINPSESREIESIPWHILLLCFLFSPVLLLFWPTMVGFVFESFVRTWFNKSRDVFQDIFDTSSCYRCIRGFFLVHG
eukprot:TRINITY_DN1011_c0_g1_i1.p1 TRINITY_DN1011_c0_g1~~TRINITY_DN1011_c0_g1_i1.p1  ORF type:complete len:97 (+),score=2.99 TRINITY_DN1011_c0_g1_i1:251-541(+)